MRLRRQFRLPLLAVLVTAGIVATDCLLRRPSEVERVDSNALSVVESRTNALRSTRSTTESQTAAAAVENVEKTSAVPADSSVLSDEAVVQLRELAEADPAAVAELAMKEPVSALRERMLLEALPLWADRDPAAAAEWLAARAPAKELDLGLLALTRHPAIATKTPDTALSLACEISDSSLRISAQRSVVQDWIRRDPSKIRIAIQQVSDLTQADRSMLLAEVNGLLASR